MGLAWYTRDLVLDGREASERDQRPYLSVFVYSVTGTPLPDGGLHVEVVPDFKVFGKTPASNVAPGWELKVANYPFSDKFTFALQSHMVSTAVAAPEELYPIEAKTLDLSKEDVAAIDAGQRRVYADGQVFYHDIFGKGRWTNFCFSINPQRINTRSGQFDACPGHNNADWNNVTKEGKQFRWTS
jgi:hypothetical protein